VTVSCCFADILSALIDNFIHNEGLMLEWRHRNAGQINFALLWERAFLVSQIQPVGIYSLVQISNIFYTKTQCLHTETNFVELSDLLRLDHWTYWQYADYCCNVFAIHSTLAKNWGSR